MTAEYFSVVGKLTAVVVQLTVLKNFLCCRSTAGSREFHKFCRSSDVDPLIRNRIGTGVVEFQIEKNHFCHTFYYAASFSQLCLLLEFCLTLNKKTQNENWICQKDFKNLLKICRWQFI